MPKISEKILKQSFELVFDRLAFILLDEITNQKDLQDFEEDFVIMKEMVSPPDNSNEVLLNILFDSSSKSSQGQKDSNNRLVYFIDIYTTGVASDEKSGDEYTTDLMHKYLRLVDYILSYTGYNMLDFDYGIIGGTSVESLNVMEPENEGNSNFSRFGRATFSVKALEQRTLFEGSFLEETDTKVKLELTDKGYQYKLIN